MWREVPPRPQPRPSERVALAPALVPFVVGALLWLVGWDVAAGLVLVAACSLLLLRLLRPGAAHAVDRALLRFGDLVGRVLAAVLLTGFAVVVVLPVGLVRTLLRRDLRLRGTPAPGSSWHPHDGRPGAPERTFATEPLPPDTAARRTSRLAPAAVGGLVLLLLVDLGVGWTYDEVIGSHDVPVGDLTGDWPARLEASPATEDDPWMPAYLDELASLEVDYVPYLLVRTRDHRGDLIHVQDGIRRTWEPEDLPADAPELWVFGGSTVWGEGQRDEHTLPSELARHADAAGRPLRVVNLGERGSTTWQDLLRFEQALAERPAPVAAVFYGGVNDISAQLQDPRPGPTHLNVDPDDAPAVGPSPSLRQRYTERSALAGLGGWLHELLFGEPAAAQVHRGGPTPPPSTDEAVADAAFVQEQALLLVESLGERHEVLTQLVWQAHRAPASDPYAALRDAVPGPLDLSAAADDADEPVWVDQVHLDEDGTALVAAALWAELAPALEATGTWS